MTKEDRHARPHARNHHRAVNHQQSLQVHIDFYILHNEHFSGRQRPKLNLKPRSKPVDDKTDARPSSIFGNAKPREQVGLLYFCKISRKLLFELNQKFQVLKEKGVEPDVEKHAEEKINRQMADLNVQN